MELNEQVATNRFADALGGPKLTPESTRAPNTLSISGIAVGSPLLRDGGGIAGRQSKGSFSFLFGEAATKIWG